jgi:hypothetical protein
MGDGLRYGDYLLDKSIVEQNKQTVYDSVSGTVIRYKD